MAWDYSDLKTKLTSDPDSIGLALAKSNTENAAILNTQHPTEKQTLDSIAAEDALGAVDPAELETLLTGAYGAEKLSAWNMILLGGTGTGEVPMTANAVEIAKKVWGSLSTTLTNLNAARKTPKTWVEHYYGVGVVATKSDIAKAREA